MNFKKIVKESRASQDKWELNKFLNLVFYRVKPQYILEIGTWHGYSAEVFIKAFKPKLLISLEKDEKWDFRGLEDPGETDAIYARPVDSHDPNTVLNVQKYFGGNKIDLIFIDGDHGYEGVKQDYELYRPLVREGGAMVFHDVCYHADKTEEVDIFWRELQKQYPLDTVTLHHPETMGTGTGVLWI